jgi:hypothetical protein
MTGLYQNNIKDLKGLELYRYENIFKLYTQGDKNFYFYNILKKIQIPENLNAELFDFISFPRKMPITTVSYRIYGTTYLWWLIAIVNNVINPFELQNGKKFRIVKAKYVKYILDEINQQLQ